MHSHFARCTQPQLDRKQAFLWGKANVWVDFSPTITFVHSPVKGIAAIFYCCENAFFWRFGTPEFSMRPSLKDQHWCHFLLMFLQDERCSFSVQMWNYHLQGLRHDLWYHCPPEKSQQMFTSILHNSLVTLTTRYGRATPSSKRVNQFR